MVNENPPAEHAPFSMLDMMGVVVAISLASLAQWQFHSTTASTLLPVIIGSPVLYWVGISVSCVVEGGLLFVAAVAVAWWRRGDRYRWEPGHHIALRSAALWLAALIAFVVERFAHSGLLPPRMASLSMNLFQLAIAAMFTIWFLWLAKVSRETQIWRWTYGVLALAPVIGVLIMMASMWSETGFGPPKNPRMVVLTQAFMALMQAASLLTATIIDVRRKLPRHWSHWIAVVASLVVLAMTLGAGVWMATRLPRFVGHT